VVSAPAGGVTCGMGTGRAGPNVDSRRALPALAAAYAENAACQRTAQPQKLHLPYGNEPETLSWQLAFPTFGKCYRRRQEAGRVRVPDLQLSHGTSDPGP
jgi:hypothetical protein